MKRIIILLILFILCLTGCGPSCPKGYDLDGDLCKKEIDSTELQDNNTCPNGYELVNNLCRKYALIEIK